MIDMEGLLSYLSTAPCIAWVGTGPSQEMKVKGWQDLAQSLLLDAKKQKRNNFVKLEEYLHKKEYPHLFGEIERTYGAEFLLERCREALKEPDEKMEGELYKSIAKLPFLGYFTTNFDDLLYTHVSKVRAVKQYDNSKNSLASIEIHAVPTLVKLHGSLSKGKEDTLILTDSQYNRWYGHGEKEYFQTFLSSFLALERFLFIGYSLKDPEILHIQKRLNTNLPRVIPAVALLSDVSDTDLDTWKRDYNISVIRYKASGSDHAELAHILNTAARFLGNERPSITISTEEAKLSQKFYLWHQFGQYKDNDTTIDALKSVILMTINELVVGPCSCNTITDILVKTIQSDQDCLRESIKSCCEKLVVEGWLSQIDGEYILEERARGLIQAYDKQYHDLIDTFLKQVQLDLSKVILDKSGGIPEQAAKCVLSTLCEIFMIRGIEMVSLDFSNKPIQLSGANDILSIIWFNANSVGKGSLGFILTNYVIDILTKPQGVAEQVIDYLSKAFLSMQVIRMHVSDIDLINEFYKNQAYLIDENVLIPLIAMGETRNDLCLSAVSAAVEKGVFLFTTEYVVKEVHKHGNWAREIIAEHGEQSKEILMAARGEGEYNANAFLAGYIHISQSKPVPYDFDTYLYECTGNRFTENNIWEKLKSLGINRLTADKCRNFNADCNQIHADIKAFIEREVAWRNLEKSTGRIEREADAYTIIFNWPEYAKSFNEVHRPQCSFLAFATSLATVAQRGPHPLKRSILASPQSLYELIIRFLGDKEKELDIGTVMTSSYFRTAGQFINKERYANFFAPLISQSREMFRKHYDLYRRYIEKELEKGVIDEYEPMDSVNFVNSLENKLESMPADIAKDTKALLDENVSLKEQLKEYAEKERRRKEYIKKQKQKSAKREKGETNKRVNNDIDEVIE